MIYLDFHYANLSPAHKDAYITGILHRDISVGNIIIHDDHGWLIDWDMSKPVSSDAKIETPRRATRTVSIGFPPSSK